MKRPKLFALDRDTQIGDLADNTKVLLKKGLGPLGLICACELAYLFFTGKPGAIAFAMIAGSTYVALLTWSRGGIGLPLLPLLVVQYLMLYGSPIVFGHDIVAASKESDVFDAGLEVLVFNFALLGAWQLGMQLFSPSKDTSYVLVDVDREGVKRLNRLGFILIVIATAYALIQCAGLADIVLDRLPAGSSSIFVAIVAASSACGFFMVGLSYGSGTMDPSKKALFWALLTLNSLISGSNFLLSTVALNISATAIGLLWGSGRPPLRFIVLVAALLSFLNVGKFSMRDRYWSSSEDETPLSIGGLADVPGHYMEWIEASFDGVTATKSSAPGAIDVAKLHDANRQTLTDRIDNLQNLLFAIDAEKNQHIEPLHGETYFLIPALLVPRIIWPSKPRTHEGQILLNVHFGRQDLNSTLKTYVAWGLLPEAYGNFGPVEGSILLGAAIGILFAWLEKETARKLAISLEGILGFGLVLNMLNSFEMVASVFVTSSFQSLVPIVLAFAPFVRRTRNDRRKTGSV